MSTTPRIDRVTVEVTCTCGEEMEFCGLSGDHLGAMVSQPCDECGQRVEISVDPMVQMVPTQPPIKDTP